MNTDELINIASAHLNRGYSEGREKILTNHGVPTERAALQQWISDTSDAQDEADGCVYHACTARTSNGVDSDLPTMEGIGCRVQRVPVRAYLVEAGEENEDDSEVAEPYWNILYGNCGVGFQETAYLACDDTFPETADPKAVAAFWRERMLHRDDIFATRAEAEAAAIAQLRERAKGASERREERQSIINDYKAGMCTYNQCVSALQGTGLKRYNAKQYLRNNQ